MKMSEKKYTENKFECNLYLFVLIMVLFFTAILSYLNPSYFTRFLGKINPLLAIFFSGIIGFVLNVFFFI